MGTFVTAHTPINLQQKMMQFRAPQPLRSSLSSCLSSPPPLLPPLSRPSALRSRGNLIIKPQTTLASLFKLIARVAHSPRPSKSFQPDSQGGRVWWGPGSGKQCRDRSMNWECLQRKAFIRSYPGKAGVGACVHVCACVYMRICTTHT